ncbi:MAG: signal peptidase II [Lysobacterales bacterium]|jgi:signal peptidase II
MKEFIRSRFDICLTLLVTTSVIFLDRITKSFFESILDLGQSIPVIHNVLHMTLVYNTGIAFGMLKDQGIVFVIVPIIAIILLIFNIYYYKKSDEVISRAYIMAFALILGGAFGNLYDRIVFGHVIDFVDFRIWPVFNVADSAITVGAVVIAIKCFLLSKESE